MTLSSSLPSAESIMQLTKGYSAFTFFSTSKPLPSGSMTSRRATSGCSFSIAARKSSQQANDERAMSFICSATRMSPQMLASSSNINTLSILSPPKLSLLYFITAQKILQVTSVTRAQQACNKFVKIFIRRRNAAKYLPYVSKNIQNGLKMIKSYAIIFTIKNNNGSKK